jgi:hypothetical protein
LFKHHAIRTHLDTYAAPRASIPVHCKNTVIEINGIFRAIVGALAALVTEMDAVITRIREPSLNPQQGSEGIDFPEILDGAGQPTRAAAGTIFMNSFQFHHSFVLDGRLSKNIWATAR